MNIKKTYQSLYYFLTVGIWRIGKDDVSHVRYFLYSVLKKLLLAIEFTTAKRITNSAAALTYSTLLAIVPIFAVVFGIARGFGYNKYIEVWFRESFSSQPQVAETIIGFVNSYLVHTKSGLFLGIGLLFMLFTVIMLISNIERTFNDIWQVKKPRSMFRTITDYTSLLLLVPIVIVITSGISIFFATIFKQIEDTMVIGSLSQFFLQIMPYVIMSGVFIVMYLFMPNTKVKPRCALVPGVLAGVAMQGLQLFYIHSQIWVSSYNAIYGSFAALPLFMLWVQISWLICLFGAELCYANQNMDEYAFKAKTEELSHRYKTLLSLIIANHICKRFAEGGKPFSALQIKLATGIPIRIVNDLLYEMTEVHIITEIPGGDKSDDSLYMPAECLTRLSVGTLVDRMESYGTWTIDIDIKQLSSPAWKEIMTRRSNYLNSQRSILLKDL